MKKNLGSKSLLYPQPVLIIATYDENNNPDAMNAAWGGVYDYDRVVLSLSERHKTYKNIMLKKAFTISMATADYVVACDYVGVESGNKVPNKMEKAGFTVTKSEFVDAPVIDQLPLALECELAGLTADGNVIGKIVNVVADESILTDGKVDIMKLKPITFDPACNGYHIIGEKVGNAFSDGLSLK